MEELSRLERRIRNDAEVKAETRIAEEFASFQHFLESEGKSQYDYTLMKRTLDELKAHFRPAILKGAADAAVEEFFQRVSRMQD
jgi:hypothetical protein